MSTTSKRVTGSTCVECGVPGRTVRAFRKLNQDLERWKDRTHIANDKSSHLRVECRRLTKQVEKLMSRIEKKEIEFDEIEKKLNESSADLRAAHARVAKLTDEFKRTRERCDNLERLLEGVRAVAGSHVG